MKWSRLLGQLIRDVVLTGLGAWIVWKQVYAAAPSIPLLVFAAGCFWPSTRSAIIDIWSGRGPSSESQHPPAEPHSGSLPPGGGTDEHA